MHVDPRSQPFNFQPLTEDTEFILYNITGAREEVNSGFTT